MAEEAFVLRGWVTAAWLAALACGPAGAAEMIDSVFQTTFTYGGAEQRIEDGIVPLLPGNACYAWWIRLAKGSKPASATERLVLPAALPDWGDTEASGLKVEEGGKVAVSTFAPELDADGWFSKGWCVAEGDPTGRHRIEVSLDGTPLTAYDFEVVKPEDYAWPALPQPDPGARSIDNSW